jgi:hypothetical protein
MLVEIPAYDRGRIHSGDRRVEDSAENLARLLRVPMTLLVWRTARQEFSSSTSAVASRR